MNGPVMIALKTWQNKQMEGHVDHGAGGGHVKRGRTFRALHESRAKQLEQHGLAARHPEGIGAGDGGTEAPAKNPPADRSAGARRTSAVAGSLSSSGPVRVPQAPISPQSVKLAGSTELRNPATAAKPSAPASVPSVGKTPPARAAAKAAPKPKPGRRASR